MKMISAILLLSCCAMLHAQQAQPPSPVAAKATTQRKKPAPWWLKLLRFAGVTATPVAQRDIPDKPAEGDIVLRDLNRSSAMRLLDGDYHSPIFGCDDSMVYALSGLTLYKVNALGGQPKPVLTDARIEKLIGIDPNACNDVLVVTTTGLPGLLSLATHDLVELEIEDSDSWYVAYLRLDERNYGVRSVNSRDPDVHNDVRNIVVTTNGNAVRVTNCAAGCVQPSLGHNGDRVIYVRLP